jgi:replicative DNA helicase
VQVQPFNVDRTPHNVELEQQVLGCLLSQNDLMMHLAEAPSEVFYDPVHQYIFGVIRARIDEGKLADATTLRFEVTEHSGLQALGGFKYLIQMQLTSIAISAFKDYVAEMMQLYARRVALDALRIGTSRMEKFEAGETPEKVLSQVEADVSAAVQAVQIKPIVHSFLGSISRAITHMDSAFNAGVVPGVSTGLEALDRGIGAMGPGDYVVLAGRPSMGKTALALNMAVKAARRDEGVFFGSLEMNDSQIAMRVISQILAERGTPVPYFNMRTGRMSSDEYRAVLEASNEQQNLPMQTCDVTCRSLSKLRASLSIAEKTLYRQRKELKLIVVDYLQLVDPAGRYRENDSMRKVEAASTAMKEMAVEYGCPVLCLSQLSRGVESRDPPVPVLSDLRDSGSIEQDADIVMFCYRPEYYLERKIEGLRGATGSGSISTLADHEASMSSARNKLTIMTAKARGGPVGSCVVFCDIKNNHIADRAPDNDMMKDLI